MIPVFNAATMAEADRTTIEDVGVPGPVLMENAARSCFEVIAELSESLSLGSSILVLAGPGNNGGDGMAIGRHASLKGFHATVALLSPAKALSSEAETQWSILKQCDVESVVCPKPEDLHAVDIESFDIVVDAMLGTGAKGAPRPPYDIAIERANSGSGFRVAVDIPTGLNADTGHASEITFEADATVTMAALKPGLVICAGPDYTGDVFVADLGAPHAPYRNTDTWSPTDYDILSWLPDIIRDRHKYSRGKVLVIGGSQNLTGAPILSSRAAIRSAAGLVVLGYPRRIEGPMLSRLPAEIMSQAIDDSDGSFASTSLDSLRASLDRVSAVAIGPGVGRTEETAAFVRAFVTETELPVVLDADGLWSFGQPADDLAKPSGPLVITPHAGELGRLLDVETSEILAHPLDHARDAARRFNAIAVLKGAPTCIAAPDGTTIISTPGNPGMATAGSGDVLTGMIAGLIAAHGGNQLIEAVAAGVYLHGRAGDIAVESYGVNSMTSSDIIDSIPDAFDSVAGGSDRD